MCSIQGLWQSRWGSLLNTGLAGRLLTTFQKGDPLSSFILCRLPQLMQAGWSQHPWEKDLGNRSCHHGPPGIGGGGPYHLKEDLCKNLRVMSPSGPEVPG